MAGGMPDDQACGAGVHSPGHYLLDIGRRAGKEASLLTFYAVQARYPGWDETMTEAEYLRVLDIARQVVNWAEKMIRE